MGSPSKFARVTVPMRLTATAAPTAAPRLPDTLPARESMLEACRALTVSELVLDRLVPVQLAVISSSSKFVAFDPEMAAVPLAPAATPIDSMDEVE